jgi:mono/diheme cytochrome c family protein
MKSSALVTALVTAALIVTSGSGQAQQRRVDAGKLEYESNCASCHGVKGKGDGPLKALLTTSPSDMTTLTKRNGGVFPINRVYEVIDGREEVKAHGPRDMPVWGRDYIYSAVEDIRDPDAFVRAKTLWLIDYIYRLQVK